MGTSRENGTSVLEVEGRLDSGIDLEKRLAWPEALAHYRRCLEDLKTSAETRDLPRVRSYARLREANALMALGRMDEARTAFDAAIRDADASGDALALARALVGAGVYAANTGDLSRGEAFLLRSCEAAEPLMTSEGRQTLGWALLNLGGLYGKRGQLDLAFLTLHKARERLFTLANWVGVATSWEIEAKLREGLGDPERARESYAEALVMYRKEGMAEKVDQLQGRIGNKAV
jgi:tetratricopeptide (TPR) repeat protein